MLRDIEGNNIETFEERNERVSKHTRGPWESRPTAGHDIHGQSVVYAETGKDVAIVYDGDANARLIAAAPELLHVCEDIMDFLKRSGYDTTLVKAAVWKARGNV